MQVVIGGRAGNKVVRRRCGFQRSQQPPEARDVVIVAPERTEARRLLLEQHAHLDGVVESSGARRARRTSGPPSSVDRPHVGAVTGTSLQHARVCTSERSACPARYSG